MPSDQLRTEFNRAYAELIAFKNHLPDIVEARRVGDYNATVTRLGECIGLDLTSFLIPDSELRRISRYSYISDIESEERTNVYDPPECDRDLVLTKIESLLTFLNLEYSPSKSKVGFRPSEVNRTLGLPGL